VATLATILLAFVGAKKNGTCVGITVGAGVG
jgi:hypothetical protein